ncbi:MAG TPA: DUF1330 domain-containing protein [Solirubrobacteraceae bacterium]|nr:DUF1330 domain-containing protein [Solirubrobacteraceae bacterium]
MSAYVIADVEVVNPERYADYTAGVPATLEPYGGRFLVRGGATEMIEGDWRPRRLVVIEFPSTDAARRWYESPEYQAILGIRHEAANARLIIAEGAA